VLLLNHPRIPSREGIWGREMAVKLAHRIVKIEEDLERDVTKSNPCSKTDAEYYSVVKISEPLRALEKLKRFRDGVHKARRFSSCSIEKSTGSERSLKLTVGVKIAKIEKFKEELVTW
jgi:hypothetical protein